MLALAAAGCRREEIQTFTTAKEPAHPQNEGAAGHGAAAHGSPAASLPQLRWHVPKEWAEQPAGGMRLARFRAGPEQGPAADISVIPLPGLSGHDADVVNIYRDRLGLPPVDEAGLSSLATTTSIGTLSGRLFDMTADAETTNGRPRLVIAVLAHAGSSWFFNLTGDAPVVESQKPVFLEFLKSITIEAAPAPAPAQAHAAPATAAATVAAPAQRPTWDVPAGWQEQPPTSMVVSRFAAGTGEDRVEVTVSVFPGDVGGLPANINRWRGQIGLQALPDEETTKLATPLDVGGVQAMLVDMTGQRSGKPLRLLGVSLPQGGQTWFFKLTGGEAAAARERAAFLQFVQSVRFPHA